jgi:hypothetical protein
VRTTASRKRRRAEDGKRATPAHKKEDTMWTRHELKERGKASFKANYWKTVLIALVLALVLGGGFRGLTIAHNGNSDPYDANERVYLDSNGLAEEMDVDYDENGQVHVNVDDGDGHVHVDLDADDPEAIGELIEQLGGGHSNASRSVPAVFGLFAGLFGLVAGLVGLLAVAIALALYAFVLSPLEVGGARFFLRNLHQQAEVREVAHAYDHNYLECVKTIFFRNLFIFLWSLLSIIPGIYKAYEYRMIPFLLSEDPTMTKDRAFAESKRMMTGQKWNVFVLDLSFLGWNLLDLITLGIVGTFYSRPYQNATNAALFEALRYGTPAPQASPWPQPMAPTPGAQMAPMGMVPMAPQDFAGQAFAGQAGVPQAFAPQAATPQGYAPQAYAEQAGAPQQFAPASQPPVPPFAAVGASEPELPATLDEEPFDGEPDVVEADDVTMPVADDVTMPEAEDVTMPVTEDVTMPAEADDDSGESTPLA